MSKYVRFSGEEAIFLQKQLLSSELELLRCSKNLNQYKTLRHEEHTLKIKAKSAIDILKEQIKILDKTLPHVEMPHASKPKKEDKEKPKISELPNDGSIEYQLQQIQKRLSELS